MFVYIVVKGTCSLVNKREQEIKITHYADSRRNDNAITLISSVLDVTSLVSIMIQCQCKK